MKKSVTIFWLILLALIVLGVAGSFYVSKQPGKYDSFAQCLADKNVIFYGAFWCPHCQATKRMFGSAQRLLPYVECSTPNGKDQLQVCKDAGIQSYPTWVFPDGSRLNGEQSLEALSQASGCQLPA